MKILTLSLSTVVCLLHGTELTPIETAQIRQVYLKNGCNGCHGNYGEGMGASPRLQGKKENVLLRRLTELKKGNTRTPFGTIMVSFAKSLDDNQTRLMAAYLANIQKQIPTERYQIDLSTTGGGS